MPGLIIQLALSWILIWFFEKGNLSVLGLTPSKKRIQHFLFGFVASSVCCAIFVLSTVGLTGTDIAINEDFTVRKFVYGSWWTFRSVLFEELIFRGVILYIAIKKLGIKTACILSAITFGVYHWFSYQAWNNPLQMIFVFILTGVAGLMLSFAFAFTRTLYLPVSLHFGWNLFNIVVFSKGPLGEQLFISKGGQQLTGIWSILLFSFQVIALPLATYWYLRKDIRQIFSLRNIPSKN